MKTLIQECNWNKKRLRFVKVNALLMFLLVYYTTSRSRSHTGKQAPGIEANLISHGNKSETQKLFYESSSLVDKAQYNCNSSSSELKRPLSCATSVKILPKPVKDYHEKV